jgi:hypothetical protein
VNNNRKVAGGQACRDHDETGGGQGRDGAGHSSRQYEGGRHQQRPHDDPWQSGRPVVDAERGQTGHRRVDRDEAARVQPVGRQDRQSGRHDALRGQDQPGLVGAQVAIAPIQAVQPDGEGQDGEQEDGQANPTPGRGFHLRR